MAWPPKIAFAKVHERPKPFDVWWFGKRSKDNEELPMATELLYNYCNYDREQFDRLNSYLEDAFNAGVEHGKKQ